MKKVAFHTLGCKVNQYETEAITEQFIDHGYEVVPFDDMADIYVINTCTVTNIADKKSRKMLSKAKKMNSNSVVVAVGCYVQVAHDTLIDIPYVDVLIGNTHKKDVVEITEKFINEGVNLSVIEDVHHDISYEELEIQTQLERTRATIKVQDGCDQYCSYCIIPYTRGAVRSRPLELVEKEVSSLVKKGFSEFVLTGIHLGSYGKDLDGKVEFIDLIEAIDQIQGVERIRLGSLEPNLMSDHFIERLSQCESVCSHFHLSLQSGSDSVLKRMKRRYTTDMYLETTNKLRKFYHNPSFTTDIIVGFPKETDQEHGETLEFLKTIGFSDLHVFKYSIREGTSAARMSPQVDGVIKNSRSKELTSLSKSMKEDYIESLLGSCDEIIIEEVVSLNNRQYYVGHTTRYNKIYALLMNQTKEDLIGTKLLVELIKSFEDGILGKVK